MTKLSVLDELRRVRHEVSGKIGHDPHQIVQYYADLQKSLGGRVVNFGDDSQASQAKDCPGAVGNAIPDGQSTPTSQSSS